MYLGVASCWVVNYNQLQLDVWSGMYELRMAVCSGVVAVNALGTGKQYSIIRMCTVNDEETC